MRFHPALNVCLLIFMDTPVGSWAFAAPLRAVSAGEAPGPLSFHRWLVTEPVPPADAPPAPRMRSSCAARPAVADCAPAQHSSPRAWAAPHAPVAHTATSAPHLWDRARDRETGYKFNMNTMVSWRLMRPVESSQVTIQSWGDVFVCFMSLVEVVGFFMLSFRREKKFIKDERNSYSNQLNKSK